MQVRGWSEQSIKTLMERPNKTFKTRDKRFLSDGSGRRNDPATAYFREDGHYVVRNDITGDIVQISNTNKEDWINPF